MMKEQRSLSVGNLPGDLKSQILKSAHVDIVARLPDPYPYSYPTKPLKPPKPPKPQAIDEPNSADQLN